MSRVEPWLHNPSATAEVIKKYEFRFKKKFGQNFLIDPNIVKKITDAADIKKDDVVLEIGPGIGTLTQHLAYNAGHVVAVEIDKSLIPVLEDTLSGYDNITLINDDILNIDIPKLIEDRGLRTPIKVIANLPYYITTPVVMGLLEESDIISSITIMVQKEVAERMAAPAGTKDYGALTLAVDHYADACKVAEVSQNCFMPRPDVASMVIQLNMKKDRIAVRDEKLMFKVIRAAFMQRRKTLINSLKNSNMFFLSKEQWEKALADAGISPNVRGETLTLEDFARLSDEAGKYL
jgi:16S rRNA (adenine1518-N6/adenine1519-N6)-dimethyltransferase